MQGPRARETIAPLVEGVDLSNEAIRLARAAHELLPHDGEVSGLLALMLLTDARRPARSGPDGEIVPLDVDGLEPWLGDPFPLVCVEISEERLHHEGARLPCRVAAATERGLVGGAHGTGARGAPQ